MHGLSQSCATMLVWFVPLSLSLSLSSIQFKEHCPITEPRWYSLVRQAQKFFALTDNLELSLN